MKLSRNLGHIFNTGTPAAPNNSVAENASDTANGYATTNGRALSQRRSVRLMPDPRYATAFFRLTQK